jgi:hypothetical protein
MKGIFPVAVATTLLILGTANLTFAKPQQQSRPQPQPASVVGSTLLEVSMSELRQVATGWSVRHQVLGRLVYNDKNQSIGRVDDVIVAPDKTATYAIIDPHRYFRMVSHEVAIPVSALREQNGKFILPHATQDDLKALPPFEYAR